MSWKMLKTPRRLTILSGPLSLNQSVSTRVLRQRHISTTSAGPSGNDDQPSWTQLNVRISTLFGVLMAVGIGTTAYGVYEFYTAFTMWPKIVRDDLRAGVKAKHQGNLNTSERYLARALETALTLPLVELTPDPHAKLSGIAIVLGEVLETNNKPEKAYEVYVAALERIQDAVRQQKGQHVAIRVSGPDRVRAAALAFKLAEMAEEYSQPEAEEEKWLVFAVEELLRVLRDTQSGGISRNAEDQSSLDLAELELPKWVARNDVVAPLERLGAFYNRTGKQEYAVPLYLSALSILLPPNSHQSSSETKCQGAHIMNSLASSLAQAASSPSPERLSQAESWAKKAIAVVNTAKASESDADVLNQCDQVLVAALFNMGSLREMIGTSSDARDWYTASHKQATAIRMRDGILEAEQAIRRLNRQSSSSSEGKTKISVS